MSGPRRAAIIGVDEYKDKEIPTLRGARNDAEEMYERLTQYGDFEVAENHLLRNEEASSANIRRAVSDLLWKADESELTLLYFSGHGLTDAYGNGYLAPFDMVKRQPLVYGIRMQELRELMLTATRNKTTILLVFDCCYSGIAAEGDRAVADGSGATVDDFLGHLDDKKFNGSGRLILTSAGSDERSREIAEGQHRLGNKAPHPHGAFTFQILESLDGKAAISGGDVTLASLFNCVSTAFEGDVHHRPKLYGSAISSLESIFLSKAAQQERLELAVEQVRAFLADDRDLVSLFRAIQGLESVLGDSPGLQQGLELRTVIDDRLAPLRMPAAGLLTTNMLELSEGCDEVFERLRQLVCRETLSFETLTAEERGLRNLVLCLFQAAAETIDVRVLQVQLTGYQQTKSSSKVPHEFPSVRA